MLRWTGLAALLVPGASTGTLRPLAVIGRTPRSPPPRGGRYTLTPTAAPGLTDGPVAMPHDLGWTPALGLVRTGTGRYALAKAIATLRPAGIVQDYHVALSGSDGNDGLTPATAFRSIAKAALATPPGIDTVRINVADGVYWGDHGQVPVPATAAARNVILRPTGAGRVVIVATGQPIGDAPDHYNAAPIWTPVSGTPGRDAIYTTPIAGNARDVCVPIDFSAGARAATPNGEALGPALVTALSLLTGPNMAFVDVPGGLLHFRPFDDRPMIGDAFVSKGGADRTNGFNVGVAAKTPTPRTFYFERLTVIGGLGGIAGNNQAAAETGAARSLIAFDRCEFYGQAENCIAPFGGFDIYGDRCMGGWSGADVWNVHNFGADNINVDAMSPHLFLFECRSEVFTGYKADHKNNDGTLHESCVGVYAMCRFGGCDGRVVGFIDRSRGVLFGGTIGPSAATDASGYRTSVSASGSAIMDLYEVTVNGDAPGPTSPSIRAEPAARLRLHGLTQAQIVASGLTTQHPENFLDETAAATLHPVAGPLRLDRAHARRGTTTRFRILGAWGDTPAGTVSATIDPASGMVTIGVDDDGCFADVALAAGVAATAVLTLEHHPRGTAATRWPVTLIGHDSHL